MVVHHFLQQSAGQTPDKEAVWEKDHWSTYAEIESRSNRISNYLREKGIRSGDRVAVLYENSVDYIVAYYAVLKAGAVTVALNTDVDAEALAYLLNDSGARAIVANGRYSRSLSAALAKSSGVVHLVVNSDDLSVFEGVDHCDKISLNEVCSGWDDNRPMVRVIDVDPASIVYTSGSTGKPKGVTLTHLNIVSNTRSITEYLELTGEDRVMVVLPFHYIYGKSLLNTHFSVGGSIVLDNRFVFPNVVLDTIEKTGVTGFSGVPSTFMILLNKSTLKQRSFESLRYVTQAGGAMAPVVQREVAEVFHPAKLFVMYGATEASARLSYLHPDKLQEKLGSIGMAIPNVELCVVDDNGNRLTPGEEGEIAARGSNIMQGYWNAPEETAQALKHGFYYTGDLGRMDEDGYLFVVGRKKDIIKVGGERISAKEIEEKIIEIESVAEVAVIGVDDPILGEAIKAIIVLAKGMRPDEEMLRKELRGRLPSIKQPSYYDFRSDLPKNASGKVMKRVLREEAAQNDI